MTPIALFAATRWEMAALRRALPTDRPIDVGGVRCFIGQQAGRSYWLIQTGIGLKAATAAARAVLEKQPMGLVISTGFAGALAPAAIGDVIVGNSLSLGEFNGVGIQVAQPIPCDPASISEVRAVIVRLGLTVHIGLVVSLSKVVCLASEKRMIGQPTGAVAVDMESAALAIVAKERDVPFMILRTVSDLVHEDLPIDFNLFSSPSNWVRGLWSLLRHPSSLIGLNRIRRQSRLAADRLTAVCSACAQAGFGLSPTRSA